LYSKIGWWARGKESWLGWKVNLKRYEMKQNMGILSYGLRLYWKGWLWCTCWLKSSKIQYTLSNFTQLTSDIFFNGDINWYYCYKWERCLINKADTVGDNDCLNSHFDMDSKPKPVGQYTSMLLLFDLSELNLQHHQTSPSINTEAKLKLIEKFGWDK
jgi:hypothetical protein